MGQLKMTETGETSHGEATRIVVHTLVYLGKTNPGKGYDANALSREFLDKDRGKVQTSNIPYILEDYVSRDLVFRSDTNPPRFRAKPELEGKLKELK